MHIKQLIICNISIDMCRKYLMDSPMRPKRFLITHGNDGRLWIIQPFLPDGTKPQYLLIGVKYIARFLCPAVLNLAAL